MLEEINQVIDKHIKKFTRSGNFPYEHIKVNSNSRHMLLENEELMERFIDYRLKKNCPVCEFCLIYFIDKVTKVIVCSTSFIFYKSDQYEQIQFWHINLQNNLLEKQSINNLFWDNQPELIMTIGFTKNLKIDIAISRFFIGLAKELLSLNILAFVETTGNEVLNDELTCRSYLDLSQIDRKICENIGKTNKYSAAVEKFCKMMGMKEQTRFLNIRTLGKVYVKKPEGLT